MSSASSSLFRPASTCAEVRGAEHGLRRGAAGRPARARLVERLQRAERLGFSHGWTFDSPVLWQEPFVIHSQDPRPHRRLIVGPMVTNPGTRDPGRSPPRCSRRSTTCSATARSAASAAATRRCACPAGRPTDARRAERGDARHQGARRGPRGATSAAAGCGSRGSRTARLPVWMAAYGPKALELTGRQADGFILQLADPFLTEWMVEACARRPSTRAATRSADRSASRRPAYVGDDPAAHARARPVPLVRRHGRQPRRRPRRAATASAPAWCPRALTDYIKAREQLRLRPPRPGRQSRHRLRARRDRRPVLPDRPARGARREAASSCATLGVDQFAIYAMHDAMDRVDRRTMRSKRIGSAAAHLAQIGPSR